MPISPLAAWMLEQEARALLTRLERVRPFVLLEPMLPAAGLQPAAQAATERYLIARRRELRARVLAFLAWLRDAAAREATAADAQRRFTMLRLGFNVVLTQFDMFSELITQRSEHGTGVWLAGLDVVAADALRLPGDYYEVPPLVCYLDQGMGAAIRRARTRLPGGGLNPVSIIRVPRERMVGSAIASSLFHEVGHQAAALLGLTESLRPTLQGMQRGGGIAWQLFERWIGEIFSDFWASARLGIGATLGLIGVVSLPRPFVFRFGLDDPHPVPWLRVLLSCAIGEALYPHPQWRRLATLWMSYYPPAGLDADRRRVFDAVRAAMPGLVSMLLNHRLAALRGRSLKDALDVAQRQPARLAALFATWRGQPAAMYRSAPSLVCAVLGQARADAQLSPEEESRLITRLLTHWALRSTLVPPAGEPGAAQCRGALRTAWLRQERSLTIH